MGWLARLVDRIDAKVDRPADESVLDDPSGGSERMIESSTPEQAGRNVRNARNRSRMRQRWLGR
jgi:hypothetical protein